MEKIVFECETITPMFMYGADGRTPELRPASIKGLMRFWWRAIHGNLSLDELKKQEGEIFGNTDIKSSFSIRIKKVFFNPKDEYPLPHKKTYQKSSFPINQIFKITFTGKNLKLVENIFKLTTILGGFGQRSRRGFGSIQITKIDDENFTPPKTVEEIKLIISKINNKFKYKSVIKYPYIKDIQIEKKSYKNFQTLLEIIGNTTHTYPDDMFGSGQPRYASPVYISVIKDNDKYRPIITTLHHTEYIDDTKLREFKEALL